MSKKPLFSLDLPDEKASVEVAQAMATRRALQTGKQAAVVVRDEDGEEVCTVIAKPPRH
jgi:hypothetical protein